jgi:SNF2 family DNA or RNA helicase
LYFEQGVGKTWIAGGLFEALSVPPLEFTCLCVVPLTNLETTWIKFLSEHLPYIQICRSLDEFKDGAGGSRILLLHYEAVKPIIKKLRKITFTNITFDEAHRLKNRTTQQGRMARGLKAATKLILTGTPMDEQPIDLWSQFAFLRPELLGPWKEFEAKFLEPLEEEISFKGVRKGSFKWIRLIRKLMIAKKRRKFDYSKLDEFLAIIRPYSYHVSSADVLSLPELKLTPFPVILRGEQRRAYEQMDLTSVLRFSDGGILTAPLKVVKNGRLHQICGGFVPDDDGKLHEVGRAKIRKVMYLIKYLTKPIVIFCRYIEEVAALKTLVAAQGYRVRHIIGQNRKDRSQIIEAFQNGKIEILINQIRTGGIGIDLFAARHGIIYSMGHSSIDFNQAFKRLHRRGQENNVEIFLLYAKNTIDEDILSDVNRKSSRVKQVP